MAQFKPLAPNVQVNGQTVLSVVDGMWFKETALRIIRKHGIDNPKPDQFYPQEAWLNAFREIAEKFGAFTLMEIGKKIPENAVFPPEIDCIEKALPAIDVAYHMNHRGGEIGHYRFEKTGERTARMICDNPYPCEFDRGIVERTAAKFAPPGATPWVGHDLSGGCRHTGASSCTYLVEW